VIVEGLAELVRQAIKVNVFEGVKVGTREVELSVLQFAYDMFFMCEDSYANVFTMKAILKCYELASELKVNFHKSMLVGINVDSPSLDVYAKTLHCTIMRIPVKYLGLEVGGNPRRKRLWEPIVSKVSVKLSVWKGRFLSLAGRICLVKSIFTSVTLFYLSFFKVPKLVCDRIISIPISFLWGWEKEEKSIPWLSWENFCKPREEGGMGIKDVRLFNVLCWKNGSRGS